MKKHIYLAGSLFSEAEVAQRLKEGEIIREQLGDSHTYFNPIEAPCNDKSKLPTCEDIFRGDTIEVLKSDVILADLSNQDPGVMMELGIAWALNYCHIMIKGNLPLYDGVTPELALSILRDMESKGIKKKDMHTVLSDIRLSSAGEYSEEEVPFSYNQYVIGGIKDIGVVHKSFVSAIEAIKEEK